MKKIILLFGILMLILNLQGQGLGNSNLTDDQGRKQGYWKSYDNMGVLKYEGRFADDIPQGEFKYYYPTEKLKAVSFIYDDGKKSRTTLYHRNGKIMATGNYLNQRKDSVWNYFSEYDGALLSEEIYINNIKEGIWTNYYPGNKMAEQITFKNDKRNGLWIQFYIDGSEKFKGNYIDDKKEGVFLNYHTNGNIEVKGSYKNSLKQGIWQHFNEENKLIKEEVFERGKLKSKNEY